jgi:hypothetical protein
MKFRVIEYWGSYKVQQRIFGMWCDYFHRGVFKTKELAEDAVRQAEARKHGTGRVVREFTIL